MKDIQEYEKDISSIRSIMEKSSKVFSLSGFSGIMAGIYALTGAAVIFYMLHYPASPFQPINYSNVDTSDLWKIVFVGGSVLVAAVLTCIGLSYTKAKKLTIAVWNNASKRLIINMFIPLLTGGLFILIMINASHYDLVAPASLLFYGLALLQISSNTYDELKYLGFSQVLFGLLAALYPGYGLLLWAFGFGVLHIFYGAVLYNKYEK
jgi:hypothetical protein